MILILSGNYPYMGWEIKKCENIGKVKVKITQSREMKRSLFRKEKN